jgi:hypothetical protein
MLSGLLICVTSLIVVSVIPTGAVSPTPVANPASLLRLLHCGFVSPASLLRLLQSGFFSGFSEERLLPVGIPSGYHSGLRNGLSSMYEPCISIAGSSAAGFSAVEELPGISCKALVLTAVVNSDSFEM